MGEIEKITHSYSHAGNQYEAQMTKIDKIFRLLNHISAQTVQ